MSESIKAPADLAQYELETTTERLRSHLSRGGAYCFVQIFNDKGSRSLWLPTDRSFHIPSKLLRGRHVYWGVNPTSCIVTPEDRLKPWAKGKADEQIAPYIGSKDSTIAAINALFADFDGKDETTPTEEEIGAGYASVKAAYMEEVSKGIIAALPPEKTMQLEGLGRAKEALFFADRAKYKALALQRVERAPIKPSVLIDSGGGYQAYWLLAETYTIDSAERREFIKWLQGAWVAVVGADPGVKDIRRILRVPGSTNVKKAYGPLFPIVSYCFAEFSRLYAVEDFIALVPERPKPKPAPVGKLPGRAGSGESIIEAFKAAYHIADVLEMAGYTWVGRRMAKPGGKHGTVEIHESDNESFHYGGGDPLCDGHRKDPFDVFLHYMHNGNMKEAVREAARMLGMNGATKEYSGFSPTPTVLEVGPAPEGEPTEETTEPAPGKRSYAEILAYLDKRAAGLPGGYATQCLYRNELGSAELLYAVASGVIAFDRGSMEWHIYNGLYWEMDKGGNVPSITGQVLSAIYRSEAAAAYAKLLELEKEIGEGKPSVEQAMKKEELKQAEKGAKDKARDLYKLAYIKNVLTFAGATSLLGVDPDLWDAQPNLLGVANAVIDLSTGKPVEPAPGQYIRTVAPAAYDPNATCPTWERSVMEILNHDRELYGYIQRLLGYAISGTAYESDFFVWLGDKDGRNGKEFILERIRAVLGGALAGLVESEILLSNKVARAKNSPTEGLMVLRGRRLAWASETEEGRILDSAAMKDLSGGHILTGRHNHGRQEEWKRTHTLILLTNYKPHIKGGGGGAEWERIKLVTFTETFTNDPAPGNPHHHLKDPTLGDKIDRRELSGLLNWLIAGCLEWHRAGLQTPTAVKDATKRYREDEDTLGRFIAEWCEAAPGAWEYGQKLYDAYKDWFISGGEGKPMGRNTFLTKLEERGYKRGARGMHGVPVDGIRIVAANLTDAYNGFKSN